MITVECTTERAGDVTLVTAIVENDGPRREVRLATAGEVWPPRRRGVPESGWDDDGLAVVLDAGERRAVGYATPDRPDDPLSVVETRRVSPDSGFETEMPMPAVEPTPTGVVRTLADPAPPRAAVRIGEANVETWVASVEERVAAAEALAAAETLAEATAAVAEVGGLTGVRELDADLETDRASLASVRGRLADVAERSRAVSVPVETFERLA